jgi:eukaryotic-like serine/threonine-protein kinase
MRMTPERWEQVKTVFAEAAALVGPARDAFLASACAGDADLAREVASLLAAHGAAAGGMLDTSAHHPGATTGPSSLVGHRFGAYDIVAELGHGGMADVFAAVRADGHYHQRVALKLVRAGYATAGIIERFRAERQILAGLDHPNIARLLDGGMTADGLPYLVMDLVDGAPIDAYCDARSLPLAARLRLFLQVCAAVEYAHRHLVIHRDIKPGNVLVTPDGVPKLLDFGIAKLLDPIGAVEETSLRPFTPAYASPEQVRGEAVSTATDVYSLGVVLYRLLTGDSPYGRDRRTTGELTDAIVHVEPARPSAVAPVVTGLRGDLDAIVLKALRKEPDKRYASVAEFAEDVRRHLDGLPVRARAGTWSYRASKVARRHRAAVVAGALVVVSLVAGIVVTAREARIAQANRRRADARFNDVRQLANSLMFEIHDSIKNLPGATDARKLILERSLAYLDRLAQESSNEPDLLRELAKGYEKVGQIQGDPTGTQLGDTKAAVASYRKSIALRESLARANPASHQDQIELASAYLAFGGLQFSVFGDARSAFDYMTRGLAIADREGAFAPDDRRLLDLRVGGRMNRATLQEGSGLYVMAGTPREAIADLQAALPILAHAKQLWPKDEVLVFQDAGVEWIIGESLLKLHDRAGALEHFRRVLTVLAPNVARGDHLSSAIESGMASCKIGDVLLIDGRYDESVTGYAVCERDIDRLAAADPHNEYLKRQSAIALVELGHALIEAGRSREGMAYIRQGIVQLDADSSDSAIARSVAALLRSWYGEALERQGQLREAAEEYTKAKQDIAFIGGAGAADPRIKSFYGAACDRLAAVSLRLGDVAGAVRAYTEVQALLEPAVRARPDDYEIAYVLAETYTAQGDMATARHAWLDAAGFYRKSLDVWHAVPHPARISTAGFEVTVPSKVSERLARSERELAARQ